MTEAAGAGRAGTRVPTDRELAAVGVHRIPVPVPFPQAGGPVNVYLVEEEDGGLLLFDAGLGTPEAEAALADGFERLGRRFGEVRRIVVSHGHVDHFGGARTVQERHGGELPVFAHPADAPKMVVNGAWRWHEQAPHYAAHLARLGVPAEAVAGIARDGRKGLSLARRLPTVSPLVGGERLRTRALALEVLHLPGHTPGLVALFDRDRGLLFAADHLLEKISPNPLIELGPGGEEGFFRPLIAYLESLGRLRSLEVDVVLPGHGPPFGGHRAVIDGLLAFYRRRQERIRELLAAQPLTAHELAAELFAPASGSQLFLVLSECVANLEVLEARAEVRRETTREGVYRFHAA